MPNYDFICDGCGHEFEQFELMENRENPTKENCPKCNEKKVRRSFEGVGYQGVVDPYHLGRVKPPNGFNEVLNRIKKGSGRGCTINV